MKPLGNHRPPFLLVQILNRPAVKAVVNSLTLIRGEAEQVSLCSFILVTILNLKVVVKIMIMIMVMAVKGVIMVMFFYRGVDVAL